MEDEKRQIVAFSVDHDGCLLHRGIIGIIRIIFKGTLTGGEENSLRFRDLLPDQKSKYHALFAEQNKPFIDFVVDVIKAADKSFADEQRSTFTNSSVRLFVGSSRQSYEIDNYNDAMGEERGFGSAFSEIKVICDAIQKALPSPTDIEVDPLLLADIYGELKYGESFERALAALELQEEVNSIRQHEKEALLEKRWQLLSSFFDAYLLDPSDQTECLDPAALAFSLQYPIESISKQKITLKHETLSCLQLRREALETRLEALNATHAKIQKMDHGKFDIIYAQTHRLAAQSEKAAIHFYFIDDKDDILQGLDNFFRRYADILPYNLQLYLVKYIDGNSVALFSTPIRGTGVIDKNYEKTIREMDLVFLKMPLGKINKIAFFLAGYFYLKRLNLFRQDDSHNPSIESPRMQAFFSHCCEMPPTRPSTPSTSMQDGNADCKMQL